MKKATVKKPVPDDHSKSEAVSDAGQNYYEDDFSPAVEPGPGYSRVTNRPSPKWSKRARLALMHFFGFR